MPRENSLSDSDGRSLTPDLEEDDHLTIEGAQPKLSPAPILPASTQRPSFGSPRQVPSILSSRRSVRPVTSPTKQLQPSHGRANLTPTDRFRAAVRKVIAMKRGTMVLTGGGRIGAEPGIDPRRPSSNELYGHITSECQIEIADYSGVSSNFMSMTNAEFVQLMNDEKASQREHWVKVRWINIGGLSWDVIKAVSLRYDLHPLALEDVFQSNMQNRSKADYFNKHLFIRVLCHELGAPAEETPAFTSSMTSEPEQMGGFASSKGEYERTLNGGSPNSDSLKHKGHSPLLPRHRTDTIRSDSQLAKLIRGEAETNTTQQKIVESQASVEALKKGEGIDVRVTPMFIFLFRDGLVISVHPKNNLNFTAPISQRLRPRDTSLRTSADASLLVQALLGLVVDKAVQVVDEYHVNISQHEQRILLRPNVKTVRSLHILSGDLILHKRTLEPIKTMIYALRRYDVDRCAALIDTSDPANEGVKVVGFMSHKSKIYLAEVYDHMDYILSSLDMFAGIAENLIGYTFNLASYEMNQVMRRLTLVTIIFLPLTLLTGYFGMNFEAMWSVNKHSDLLFWEIAIPVMLIIIPMSMTSDIKKLAHYIQNRAASKDAIKSYKRA